MDTHAYTEVTDAAELRALLGEPTARDAAKDRPGLHEMDKAFIAASPFCLVATSAADGTCDVSPKGDPAGFALVLDDHTLVIPERPGNRRGDGFHNILGNPHIGLIFLIPGRADTLRVTGRARLLSDAPFFDRMTVKGHRPKIAVLVEIETVFYHCAKALLRSSLWKPETWAPQAAPSRAVISKALERKDEPLEELERYYGPTYGGNLYAP
ncbi:pyridoxamine 5'-phosphate oxidase family protein [Kitasatospora sp. NPDC004240]